jgi:hypothetical protein
MPAIVLDGNPPASIMDERRLTSLGLPVFARDADDRDRFERLFETADEDRGLSSSSG